MAVWTLDWEALERVITADVVFPGSAACDELPKWSALDPKAIQDYPDRPSGLGDLVEAVGIDNRDSGERIAPQP